MRLRFSILLLLLIWQTAHAQEDKQLYKKVDNALLQEFENIESGVSQTINRWQVKRSFTEELPVLKFAELKQTSVSQELKRLSVMELQPIINLRGRRMSDYVWSEKASLFFNFANAGFSNWNGGGENALSVRTMLLYEAKRETNTNLFIINAKMAYGLARIGNQVKRIEKTDDELRLSVEYSEKIDFQWSINAKTQILTQFAEGFQRSIDAQTKAETLTIISNFMSPAFVDISLGGLNTRKFVEKEWEFVTGIYPISGKMTIVTDTTIDVTRFRIDKGSHIRSELGLQVESFSRMKLIENVYFTNKLKLFSNYLKMQNIDINWESMIEMKINKYMTANFNTSLMYDDDININGEGPKIQFKHLLNIGIGFNF